MWKNKIFGAYLGLVVRTIIIGLSFIFVKTALQYGNAIDLLAHRFSIAFVLVILLLLFGVIKTPKLNRKKLQTLMFLSVSYPVLFFLFQTYGMQYSSASEAGIIFAMSPVITLIIAQIFLKETTTILQKAGILLSVIGILYIIFSKGNFIENLDNIKGFGLLLLSVLSVSGYLVIGKKSGAQFTSIEITMWTTLIACIVFNIWSIVSHFNNGTIIEFFQPFEHTHFLWAILYLGILSSVLTSFFTNYALPLIPASQMAVFNNLSPIFAILGGVLFLNETLYMYHIVGGIFVSIGVVMTIIFKNSKK